jgi:hypothetical protein
MLGVVFMVADVYALTGPLSVQQLVSVPVKHAIPLSERDPFAEPLYHGVASQHEKRYAGT